MLHTSWPRVCIAVCASSSAHCAFAPEFPVDGALPEPVVRALDARGEEVPLDRLPRRPHLRVTLHAAPSAQTARPWLLTGSSDPALLDDLAALPLKAEHLSRSVAVLHRWAGSRLELEPVGALQPGAVYTLALPRKAAMALPYPFTAALRVDDSPLAGADVRATFPAAGAAGVPSDLAYALVSFDGSVSGEQGLWLEDDAGRAHPAQVEDVDCGDYDTDAVSCRRVRPNAPLEPGRRYALRSGRELRDGHGAAVTELDAAFTTQLEASDSRSAWLHSACALDERELAFGCAVITDFSVELRLFHNPSVRVVAELGAQRVARLPSAVPAAIRFSELAPDSMYLLHMHSYDAASNVETTKAALHTAPPLPTLAIAELRADPLGSEPEQEYVELWNFGTAAVSLSGLLLSDAPQQPGTAIAQDVWLDPDARALLVSDGFDPADARDAAPAPGCLLVRMGKSVTRGGLANSGERLFLRTAEGSRVSEAPSTPLVRAGQCLVRFPDDSWSGADCTPGR
jgi:hypothetical protein